MDRVDADDDDLGVEGARATIWMDADVSIAVSEPTAPDQRATEA